MTEIAVFSISPEFLSWLMELGEQPVFDYQRAATEGIAKGLPEEIYLKYLDGGHRLPAVEVLERACKSLAIRFSADSPMQFTFVQTDNQEYYCHPQEWWPVFWAISEHLERNKPNLPEDPAEQIEVIIVRIETTYTGLFLDELFDLARELGWGMGATDNYGGREGIRSVNHWIKQVSLRTCTVESGRYRVDDCPYTWQPDDERWGRVVAALQARLRRLHVGVPT